MANDADRVQDERIRENRDAISGLTTKVGTMETDLAVVRAEMGGVRSELESVNKQMETGFTDIKDTILGERKADREDRKWLWGRVFGVITTLLGLAGAGTGAAYYATGSADAVESAPVEAAP